MLGALPVLVPFWYLPTARVRRATVFASSARKQWAQLTLAQAPFLPTQVSSPTILLLRRALKTGMFPLE